MHLTGKVAIVTGGTGGLGRSVARTLLEAGATVVLPHRTEGELDRLRTQLQLANDAALSGAVVDLTDEDATERYYAQVATELGGVDILVNLAGGFAGGQPVHETPWTVWQEQLDINLKTAVISSRAAVPHMIMRGGGAVVHVSARAATQAGAQLAAYASAKRAILQLTEAMAAELRDHGITVNAVLPSTIDTPANRAAMPNAKHSRWVQPEAIARVILFLVGDNAHIISGAHIPVYGMA